MNKYKIYDTLFCLVDCSCIKTVELILKKTKLDSPKNIDVLNVAIRNNDMSMVKLLINNSKFIIDDISEAIYTTCYFGNIDLLKLIIIGRNIHPQTINKAILIAQKRNNVLIVKYLSTKAPNGSYTNNDCIKNILIDLSTIVARINYNYLKYAK